MTPFAVADELEREGISLEVFDPRTLLPLDRELLAVSVAETGRIAIFKRSLSTPVFASRARGPTRIVGAHDAVQEP
jgi:pyruvate/2-oxoglutarate/acetoin dehydrogenase E1 component